MAFVIVWTARAKRNFESVIRYLHENWSEQEVKNFVRESFHFFDFLTKHPEILEKSEFKKNIYRGPMDKHNILTYRVKPQKRQIELLNIRSAKQKPNGL